jgi:hypothetical protein
MSDYKELIARLRSMHWCVTTKANGVGVSDGAVAREAADRIEALTDELSIAKWLLTDAAVQLEEGKIKTRRNRAGLIWQFLEEIKGDEP